MENINGDISYGVLSMTETDYIKTGIQLGDSFFIILEQVLINVQDILIIK